MTLIKCYLVARPIARAIRRTVIAAPRRIVRAVATVPTLVCVTVGSVSTPAGLPDQPRITAHDFGGYGAGYAPGAAVAWLPVRGSVLDGPAGLSGAVVPVVALAGPVTAAQPVPEPAGVWVLLAGMLALVGVGRRA